MTNVIKLNTRSRSPADLLESLREKVEAGEIETLMFCVIDSAGRISTRWSTAPILELLGMASALDFSVKREHLDSAEL